MNCARPEVQGVPRARLRSSFRRTLPMPRRCACAKDAARSSAEDADNIPGRKSRYKSPEFGRTSRKMQESKLGKMKWKAVSQHVSAEDYPNIFRSHLGLVKNILSVRPSISINRRSLSPRGSYYESLIALQPYGLTALRPYGLTALRPYGLTAGFAASFLYFTCPTFLSIYISTFSSFLLSNDNISQEDFLRIGIYE